VGVLMDLMLCYGGTTAPRPRKLVDVRYRARGPRRVWFAWPFLPTGAAPSGWASKGPSRHPKLSRFYGAGEAMVETPNVKMIRYNRSTTEPMRVVTFYVSDPDAPFLDPIFMSASSHQRRSDCAPIAFGLAWQATRHNVAGAEASPRPER
jgi:hypothetical protein